MNQKSIQTLEFPKILSMLRDLADSSLAKDLCTNLLPSTNFEEIVTLQKETTAAVDKIRLKGSINFSNLKDIKGALKRLEIGASLSILELFNIGSLLRLSKKIRQYGLENIDNKEEKENILDTYFLDLQEIKDISIDLDRYIISNEAIADDASKELKDIRKKLKNINLNIHNYLNQIMNSYREYLMEAVVTIRNSAYCIPVKAEFKNKVNGIVHGQSSSGSTFFIEPISIIKLNNEIKELEIAQEKEIEKILLDFSLRIIPYIENLRTNQDILTKLDFIFAKAKLSIKLSANEAIFNKDFYINIKEARHPLLNKENIVPIDISLGKDYNLLIITGPNTGGKTVSLKTVGLFTLMGQAGLHIPAFYGSELSVFDEVFADIGDEQSIEQSLSFFSGHMKNIINIINKANYKSLCLFDELGAGTDPTEGAALAIAILSYLNKNKIRTIASTHYSELKIFALNTEFVENASCEFDLESLRPTYRILIGIAGKSNAFAISEKLGLPKNIINDAKSHIGINEQNFEDLLFKLEEDKKYIEEAKKQIEADKIEIERLRKKYKEKDNKLDKRSLDIINQAKEEASKILKEAKNTADESIKNINKIANVAGLGRALEEQRENLRKEINKNIIQSDIKINKNKKEVKAKELKIGDRVRVNSLNLEASISSLPNSKGLLFVQMGILRTQVNISDISLLEEKKEEKSDNYKTKASSFMKAANISPQINLIALNVDEACSLLDKYLDDALLANLDSVKIIHGRGTYALQKGIHAYLKKLKFVKSYHLADFEEGGSAITIVHFK